MIIVSDTTPLSELAKVGKLNLLHDIYGKIIIPQEVYHEVTTGNHPAVNLVQLADWIERRTISSSEKVSTLKTITNWEHLTYAMSINTYRCQQLENLQLDHKEK